MCGCPVWFSKTSCCRVRAKHHKLTYTKTNSETPSETLWRYRVVWDTYVSVFFFVVFGGLLCSHVSAKDRFGRYKLSSLKGKDVKWVFVYSCVEGTDVQVQGDQKKTCHTMTRINTFLLTLLQMKSSWEQLKWLCSFILINITCCFMMLIITGMAGIDR